MFVLLKLSMTLLFAFLLKNNQYEQNPKTDAMSFIVRHRVFAYVINVLFLPLPVLFKVTIKNIKTYR